MKKNFLKMERTLQEKITRLEKAKRPRVCLVMHRKFLCSGNYITFIHMLFNKVKFKAKKTISKTDADLSCFFFNPLPQNAAF